MVLRKRKGQTHHKSKPISSIWSSQSTMPLLHINPMSRILLSGKLTHLLIKIPILKYLNLRILKFLILPWAKKWVKGNLDKLCLSDINKLGGSADLKLWTKKILKIKTTQVKLLESLAFNFISRIAILHSYLATFQIRRISIYWYNSAQVASFYRS